MCSLVMCNVMSRKESSVKLNGVRKLKSEMNVGCEVDAILKFRTDTKGDSDYVVEVSVVKLRHKKTVL